MLACFVVEALSKRTDSLMGGFGKRQGKKTLLVDATTKQDTPAEVERLKGKLSEETRVYP